VIAEAEIALVSRDLAWPEKPLEAARVALEHRGDRINAAHARYLGIRRLVLIGRIDEAERELAELDMDSLRPASTAALELVVAGIAMRRLHIEAASAALVRARKAARPAGIAALSAEIDEAEHRLREPVARRLLRGKECVLRLDGVETLFRSGALVVDACRHDVREAGTLIGLGTRPVLFTLMRALAEAWPVDVSRDVLVARAFRGKQADESHRARLRVEVGRLRQAIKPMAAIRATPRGFDLIPRSTREVSVLLPLYATSSALK
jgi:hypothetical protein